MPRIALCPTNRLASAPLLRVAVPGLPPLVVGRHAGAWFALADACNHGEASLADGTLEGDELVCPHHRGAFAVATGAATRPPCHRPQARYAVGEEDGMLWVDL